MRKLRWMVFGVALPAALLVAAIAQGVKISERSEDFTVDPFAQETVDCGAQRAVSGGFFGGSDPLVTPLVSTRQDGSQWTFRAGAFNGVPADATAYAYCEKKNRFPRLRESSESGAVDFDQLESVTAECPGARRAVSGGFELPLSEFFVTTSMRSGRRSWTVEFYNGGGQSETEVEASVYCAKDVRLKQRSSTTILPDDDPETEKARCKPNQRVVSGGFDTESDRDAPVTVGRSIVSRRAGKRAWEVRAFAEASPQPLTVFAYCLKQPKKK
jgi:hypothetical protein